MLTDSQHQALATASEGKHTPPPWRVSESDASVIFADDDTGSSDYPFAIAFCEPCVPMNGDGDYGQFNAAQIVRAVNAHDDLVTALTKAVAAIAAGHRIVAGLPCHQAMVAAIAKASP